MPTLCYTYFIAHATADSGRARELYDLLHPQIPCFLDVVDLFPGAAWDKELREGQAASRATVVLISAPTPQHPHYRDAEIADAIAFWCRNEAAHWVVPVYLDGIPSDPAHVPYGLTNINGLDAKTLGLQGLAESLRNLAIKLNAVHASKKTADSAAAPASDNLLRSLFQQRAEAEAASDTTRITAITNEILDRQRKQRAGGQLQGGDLLGDGRYELLERRGKGGFATVWKAWDDKTRRFVAVKVLHADHAGDRSRRERFFRGARQMATLDHPGIVRVFEPHGVDDGWHYFVMEFIDGEDLDKAMHRGRVDAERGLAIVLDVAEALQYAHSRKLVHLDVTPSNILLDREGRPHLTDFDLVHAADTTGGTRTSAMGKWVYAPPEMRKRPQDTDARSDVYSLGMTLAFVYAGGSLDDDVLYKQKRYLAALPCSSRVRGAITRAIKRRMNERPASVAELVRALRAPAPSVPVMTSARPVSPAAPSSSTPVGTAMRGAGSRPGEVWVEPATGVTFVWIPSGEFLMGDPPGVKVKLTQGVWIGQHPVTNDAYGRFLAAAKHREPEYWRNARLNKPDQPVVGVNWHDAMAFSAWATKSAAFDDGREITLPTEAQWEYTVRAAGGERLRAYPWGDEAPTPERAVFLDSSGLAKVGDRPAGATPLGVHDLAGNAWDVVPRRLEGRALGRQRPLRESFA